MNVRVRMVDSALKDQPESSNPSLKRRRMSPEITAELTNLAAHGNKILEIAKTIPRRSQRIQNTASSSQDRNNEPMIENIEINDHEEGRQCSYEEKKASKAVLSARNTEEKIDNIIILLEEQGKTIEALLSKGVDTDRFIVTEDPQDATKELKAVAIPRRSQRIQNTASSSQDRNNEPVIENIEVSDHEEGHHCSYEEKKASKAVLGARNTEEKIDNLIILLEEQGKTIEALLFKGVDRCIVTEGPCASDVGSEMKKDKYKYMYIESQKKINDLKDENYELRKNLETTLGKLEAYENGQLVFSDAIEKLKDACVISSVTKATEIMLGLSSRANACDFAVPTAFPDANSPAAKRKKITKAKGKDVAGSSGKEE